MIGPVCKLSHQDERARFYDACGTNPQLVEQCVEMPADGCSRLADDPRVERELLDGYFLFRGKRMRVPCHEHERIRKELSLLHVADRMSLKRKSPQNDALPTPLPEQRLLADASPKKKVHNLDHARLAGAVARASVVVPLVPFCEKDVEAYFRLLTLSPHFY